MNGIARILRGRGPGCFGGSHISQSRIVCCFFDRANSHLNRGGLCGVPGSEKPPGQEAHPTRCLRLRVSAGVRYGVRRMNVDFLNRRVDVTISSRMLGWCQMRSRDRRFAKDGGASRGGIDTDLSGGERWHKRLRRMIALPGLLTVLLVVDAGLCSPLAAQSSPRIPSATTANSSDATPARNPLPSRPRMAEDANSVSAEVLVYGATPSGIMAAIEAARLGRRVILLEPTQHVGGIMTNGLGATDQYGNDDFGGLAAQFFQQVNRYYDGTPAAGNGYYFEPHVAEAEFNTMLASHSNITLKLGVEFTSVAMSGTTITSLTASDGVSYQASEFIDASYTGDLMAAAGVSYTVGRESTAKYNESIAGVGILAPIASSSINSYVTPGDASSGLIAHVSADNLGAEGSADSAVMAYNYRLCVTTDPNNQIPFTEPPNYDAAEFAILTRMFASRTPLTASEVVSNIGLLSIGGLPNSKYDLNDGATFPILGTDEVGESFGYPDGSAAVREGIEAEQTRYIHALLYFLSNDPSVPQAVQAAVQTLGLCKDEFTDNGGWPHQIYVREARRMIGQYVLTLRDLQRQTTIPDSIGLGGYPIDSHPVHIVNVNGAVEYEPAPKGLPSIGEYLLPYRILTPRADQATNLLVPVDVSASHVAYDSVRLEPTYMIMGQAAGASASIAIEQGTSVQSVPYGVLSSQLLSDGVALSVPKLSTTSLAFQTQPVGVASQSQYVSLTNTGTSALTITGFTVTGANASSFVFQNSCGTSVAAGASCTIHGHFAPTALGSMTASLGITESTGGAPLTIALTGTGVTATGMTVSATSLSFGTVAIGAESASQFVTLTNSGTGTQSISGINVTGANAASFVFGNSCGSTLAAGFNCTIHGHFAPVLPGPQTATVTITDSASNSPQTITLTGNGGSPTKVLLSQHGLSYGAVETGRASAPQSVTLTNTGGSALKISSIKVTGSDASSFLFTNNCGSRLAVGASCTIEGSFAPTTGGAATASIAIADSAQGSPQTFALSGSGNWAPKKPDRPMTLHSAAR